MKTNSTINRKERRDRKGKLGNSMSSMCSLRSLWLAISLLIGLRGYSALAQVQQAWIAKYNNGILNGTNQAAKMALDSAGNIYITGFSQNTNGNLDYATIKYTPNGTQVWSARFDSTNVASAVPAGIVLDTSNNVIVTGSAITIKYNTNGTQLWTAPYAGTSVAADRNGNVCITGFGTNFNTVKLSPASSNIWITTYPSPYGPSVGGKVVIDSSGNVYVSGMDTSDMLFIQDYRKGLITIKWDSNGNQLWVSGPFLGAMNPSAVDAKTATFDNMGSLYVFANFLSIGAAVPYVTVKYAIDSGTIAWIDSNPTGDDFSLASGLILDGSGNAFVTGQNSYYPTNSSYGTYKINTSGAYVWTNLYPSVPPKSINVGTAIAVDQANNVYVTGYSPGTNTGNDIVTIKYDNNGNQLWVQRYNGPGNGDDEGNAIAVDASGNVYVTGYETTAAGGTEMVTIKYAPSPAGSIQTNHAFLLQVQGEPGQPFDIQATTNFTNWLDLGQTNADTNGHLQYLDTNAALYHQRFYTTKPQ